MYLIYKHQMEIIVFKSFCVLFFLISISLLIYFGFETEVYEYILHRLGWGKMGIKVIVSSFHPKKLWC